MSAEALDEPKVAILEIRGDDARLPHDVERNTAGVAVRSLLERAGLTDRGVGLRIDKRMPLASGLGSSAASAVAAVKAAAAMLGLELGPDELLRCALAGESMACGSSHADNAAPCVYGGMVLVRSSDPVDVVPLPVPTGLCCAVVRPHVEIETRAAREALGATVCLAAATRQWGNLGALVAGLFRQDLELIARALEDHIAEPIRASSVPGFGAVKEAAREAGALGCSLSGSGPSIFALCSSRGVAEQVADAMVGALDSEGVKADRLVSPAGGPGVTLLETSR